MRKPFSTILFCLTALLAFAQQSQTAIQVQNGFEAELKQMKTTKLDLAINSEYNEFNPLISPDDNMLYFSRKNHPQNMGNDNHSDIWVAYREMDGSWGRAINLGGPANDRSENQLAGINSKGNLLYITNYNKRGDFQNIVQSTQQGRSWSIPREVKIYTDTLFRNYKEFNLSADGKHMLFTAAKGSIEPRDIYVSHFTSTEGWTAPQSLGINIQFGQKEIYPYLATDGKTLYFSANLPTGYGGLDLYVCRRQDESWTSWSAPENLGAEVNTPNNEYSCSLPASGDYIYYTSGDSVQSNIYQSFLPDRLRPGSVVLLSGKILDGETYETLPIDLNVKTLNQEGNSESSIFIQQGNFHLLVPEGTDLGLYAVASEGYFPVSEVMEMSNAGLEELDGNLEGKHGAGEEAIVYSYSSREIEKNKLQLRRLNDEIQKLERERKKINYPQLNEPLDPKIPLRSRYRSNPELDALRQRFQEMQREKKKQLLKKTQAKGEGLENKEENKSVVLSDQYGSEEADKGPQRPAVPVPVDEELVELRKKFNSFYYQQQKGGTGQGQGGERENNRLSKDDKAFEKLERRMRRELKTELRYSVLLELQEELVEPELLKAQKKMPLSSRRLINKSIKKAVREELKKRLLEREKIDQENRKVKKTTHTPLEKDLKTVLSPETKSELKEQLTETLRIEIQQELKYQLKKREQQRLGLELQDNIYQHKNQKKRKASDLSDPLPEVSVSENRKIEYEQIEKDILLLPLKKGQVIPLNNIFFKANTAILKEASYNELERVSSLLNQQTELSIEIGSHTNSWVSESLASQITTGRAEAIRDYLTNKGVASERIQVKGYGSERPLLSNLTKKGRKKNQRIELKILNLD